MNQQKVVITTICSIEKLGGSEIESCLNGRSGTLSRGSRAPLSLLPSVVGGPSWEDSGRTGRQGTTQIQARNVVDQRGGGLVGGRDVRGRGREARARPAGRLGPEDHPIPGRLRLGQQGGSSQLHLLHHPTLSLQAISDWVTN